MPAGPGCFASSSPADRAAAATTARCIRAAETVATVGEAMQQQPCQQPTPARASMALWAAVD